MPIKDLTGHRYGKLLVIGLTNERTKSRNTVWLCECECGTRITTTSKVLQCGDRKSCGNVLCRYGFDNNEDRFFSTMYSAHKSSCRQRQIPNYLTLEQHTELIRMPCHYCGMFRNGGYYPSAYNVDIQFSGIDRVDSAGAYYYENCVSCCQMCNRGKFEYNTETFLAWIYDVYHYNFD